MKQKSLKWLGFISSILITITMIYTFLLDAKNISDNEMGFFLIVAFLLTLPAILSSIASLFEKFNWLYLFGINYFTMGMIFLIWIEGSFIYIAFLFIILPSITLFLIPIIDKTIFKDTE
ncbi:MAG: hypothetical protein R6V14_05910 [Halanaerobiales bacterium]